MKKKILAIGLVVCMLVVAIGSATMAYFTDTEEVVENVMTVGKVDIYMDEEFNEDLPLLPNVEIEKLVEVENRGTVDAYVRVLLAVEDTWDITNKATITYTNESNLTKCAQTVIDGALYTVYEYLYPGKLAAGASFTSLESILWNKELTQEEAAILGESFNVLVMAQAVQADGVADNAKAALDTAFVAVDYAYAAELFGGVVPNYVATDAELETALTNTTEEIAVVMTANATYDVAAWAAKGMGGDSTEKVTIIGANEATTLTFYQTNSDWNNVVTKNDAELVLTGLKLTNSGHNNGPWNRHDINFACPVVMTCVESDKAFAFKNSADLTNVKVSDANTSDTYAIWIQPNGQTVTMDGILIDMEACTDGRGIKIDEQYVSAPEKVTLNVSNATFITEEKAAILVKSAAGADINLSNVDIRKVAADSVNPVWVDEKAASYYDLVTVTGGTKILEPVFVSNADELRAAINEASEGTTIILLPGKYEGKVDMNKAVSGITLSGSKGVVADCINLNGAKNVTLKNIEFDAAGAQQVVDGKGNAKHYANIFGASGSNAAGAKIGARDVLIEGCTFTGNYANGGDAIAFADQSRTTGPSGNITIKDCVFKTTGAYYNVYTFYSGDGAFNIEGCEFDSDVRGCAIYLGRYQSNTPVVVKDNSFNVATFEEAAAIQAHSGSYTVSFDASNNTFAG